jgi:transposase-like protein
MPKAKGTNAGHKYAGRWTEEVAREALQALEASGLTTLDFAAQDGVHASRLYYWRARLREQQRAAFIEVKRESAAAIEVALQEGHVVRVPVGFDAETLRRVVAALTEVDERC